MQSLYRISAFFLASCVICLNSSFAQAHEGNSIAIHAGIGGFSSQYLSNQAFFAAGEWYSGTWSIGVRAMIMGKDNSDVAKTPDNTARLTNSLNDVSALLGYHHDANLVFAAIAAGPSITFGHLIRAQQRLDTTAFDNRYYESVKLRALGLTIDSKLGAYLSTRTSLQLHGFFTRTSAISYLGYALEFGVQF